MADDESTVRRAPTDPLECRQNAERSLPGNQAGASVWALLAIAGELAEIRRELRKRR